MLKKRYAVMIATSAMIFAVLVGASTNASKEITSNNQTKSAQTEAQTEEVVDTTALVEEHFKFLSNKDVEMSSFNSNVKIDKLAMTTENNKMLAVAQVQAPKNIQVVFVCDNQILESEKMDGDLTTSDDFTVVLDKYTEGKKGSWVYENAKTGLSYLIQDESSNWANYHVYAFNSETGCITEVEQAEPASLAG